MPAKDLSKEQLEDASRLKAAFKKWQAVRRDRGEPWAQDAIAEELLGFGQSALAQYLNGTIPLNPVALKKFCTVLQLPPAAISPSITEREIARAFDWISVEPPEVAGPKEIPVGGPGIRLTPEQKRRHSGKTTRKVK